MATITKDTVIAMRKDINEALKAVGSKYGVVLAAGNATFSELECTFKLNVTVQPSEDFDPQKAQWDQNAPRYGLTKEAYGQTIRINGQEYRICGFDTKARVNKILVESQGRTYRVDASTVKRALTAPAEEPSAEANTSAAGPAGEQQPDDFEIKAFICGLKGKCHYGQILTFQGKQYRLIGFNTKAPQYPLICEDMNSWRTYRLPKTALGNEFASNNP